MSGEGREQCVLKSIFQGVSPYLSVSECDDICQALRDSINLFISGSHDTYIEQVEKYNKTSDILETLTTEKQQEEMKTKDSWEGRNQTLFIHRK